MGWEMGWVEMEFDVRWPWPGLSTRRRGLRNVRSLPGYQNRDIQRGPVGSMQDPSRLRVEGLKQGRDMGVIDGIIDGLKDGH